MKYFITVFGRDNVFMEVQYHGFIAEKECYPKLAFIAESLDIDLIATNDPRYIHNSQDEMLAYQIIQYNKNKKYNPTVDEDREYYIKTDDELKQALSKILSVHQAEIAVGKCNMSDEDIFKVANSRLGLYRRCSMNVVNYLLSPKLLEKSNKKEGRPALVNPLNYYLS